MYKNINTMTWAEVAALDPASVICVLPVSSLEQHGRALPLGTDDFILMTSVREMQKHLPELKHNFLQYPAIHYGSSWEHMDFAGSAAIRHTTIVTYLEDLFQSMLRHGFRKLVIINSHGGNAPIFQGCSQEWEQRFGIRVYNINYFGSNFFEDAQDLIETPVGNDIHGGEIEASYLAYAMPEVFHRDEASPEQDIFVSLTEYYSGWLSRDLAPDNGLIGMASRATVEKGRKLYDYVWQKLVRYMQTFDDLE